MAKSAGDVTVCLNSIDPNASWSLHKAELRRCFGDNKIRVHSATQLNTFRIQKDTESLRVYVGLFADKHYKATNTLASQDFELPTKVNFLGKLTNARIRNKVTQSKEFQDFDKFSLQDCFRAALEQEGIGMVSEAVNMIQRPLKLRTTLAPSVPKMVFKTEPVTTTKTTNNKNKATTSYTGPITRAKAKQHASAVVRNNT